MYSYGGFMLRFDRKQQNSVKQLFVNKKYIKKKRVRIAHGMLLSVANNNRKREVLALDAQSCPTLCDPVDC